MTQRTESLVTTLQIDGSDGEKYIARIEGTDVDLQVQSNVTYASVRLPPVDPAGLPGVSRRGGRKTPPPCFPSRSRSRRTLCRPMALSSPRTEN